MDNEEKSVKEGSPFAADNNENSTVQGGSNFGQGSAGLGKKAIHQGEHKSEGSNYDNEGNWVNEALRSADIKTTNGEKETD